MLLRPNYGSTEFASEYNVQPPTRRLTKEENRCNVCLREFGVVDDADYLAPCLALRLPCKHYIGHKCFMQMEYHGLKMRCNVCGHGLEKKVTTASEEGKRMTITREPRTTERRLHFPPAGVPRREPVPTTGMPLIFVFPIFLVRQFRKLLDRIGDALVTWPSLRYFRHPILLSGLHHSIAAMDATHAWLRFVATPPTLRFQHFLRISLRHNHKAQIAWIQAVVSMTLLLTSPTCGPEDRKNFIVASGLASFYFCSLLLMKFWTSKVGTRFWTPEVKKGWIEALVISLSFWSLYGLFLSTVFYSASGWLTRGIMAPLLLVNLGIQLNAVWRDTKGGRVRVLGYYEW
ncbi:hypothetical protein CC80DRAFT_544419 [Byssothecium circinans]|uniref:RING-type domain-containing protein n=1 Tax=Byssothecium circinans TaxID=147558 RepID=A0A6A5UB42_9PLEO|nr:hypothetical protein CC80DRAFT_544419 [Byssothecium circinans]